MHREKERFRQAWLRDLYIRYRAVDSPEFTRMSISWLPAVVAIGGLGDLRNNERYAVGCVGIDINLHESRLIVVTEMGKRGDPL